MSINTAEQSKPLCHQTPQLKDRALDVLWVNLMRGGATAALDSAFLTLLSSIGDPAS